MLTAATKKDPWRQWVIILIAAEKTTNKNITTKPKKP